MSRKLTIVILIAISAGTGCGGEEVGTACAPLVSTNSMFANSLHSNGLSGNGMWFNGLWFNGLVYNGLWINGLRDPLKRQLLEYTVSCALRADQELVVPFEGRELVFPGGLGLVPEWGTAEGRCDATCEGWLSACLIARVNARGEKRLISMRGHHPSLAVSAQEARRFTEPEATYFGDLASRRFFACLPDGAQQIPRVCGPDLSSCFLEVVGRCSAVCQRGVCRDTRGTRYEQAISVYLPPEGAADACGH